MWVLLVSLYLSCLLRESNPPLIFLLFTTNGWCVLVSWVILLSGVTFALARGHHGYLVGPGTAVLALQPDPLGSGSVNDAAPFLGITTAPVPPSIGPDPVRQHMGRKTFTRTHQLLDGVHAGALAIRDVLCGPQLSAAHLALVRAWNKKKKSHQCTICDLFCSDTKSLNVKKYIKKSDLNIYQQFKIKYDSMCPCSLKTMKP